MGIVFALLSLGLMRWIVGQYLHPPYRGHNTKSQTPHRVIFVVYIALFMTLYGMGINFHWWGPFIYRGHPFHW